MRFHGVDRDNLYLHKQINLFMCNFMSVLKFLWWEKAIEVFLALPKIGKPFLFPSSGIRLINSIDSNSISFWNFRTTRSCNTIQVSEIINYLFLFIY
jgi:hypothetical protein